MTGSSITGSYAGLFGSAFLEGFSEPISLALLQRFDLSRSELGVLETDVLTRADQATHAWPVAHQRLLLVVVRAIAHAENLRAKWNPKVLRPRHQSLFVEVVRALELVKHFALDVRNAFRRNRSPHGSHNGFHCRGLRGDGYF
jgi:hypothetical protein